VALAGWDLSVSIEGPTRGAVARFQRRLSAWRSFGRRDQRNRNLCREIELGVQEWPPCTWPRFLALANPTCTGDRGPGSVRARQTDAPAQVCDGKKGGQFLTTLVSVTRMRCDECRRELPADELIYRVRRARLGLGYWTSVCAGCLKMPQDERRGWLPARRCDHCGRPVIADRLRKGSRFVCSIECRKALYDEHYRRARRKRPTPRPCQSCGMQFVAKRIDAKLCSEACRQRAHRASKRTA
jgi:hypothetical protein